MRFNDPTGTWLAYKAQPTKELRDELLLYYLPLVRYVAERLAVRLPSFVDVDDLASMGTFGLLDAIERFDPTLGVRFKTYAMNRIRGSILDQVRENDWVPRLVRIKAAQIDRAMERLQGQLGREPNWDELARAVDLSYGDLHALVDGGSAVAMISLSEEWDDQEGNHGNRKIDLVEDQRRDADPVERLMLEEEQGLANVLAVMRSSFDETTLAVLGLYYDEGWSMKRIALLFDLTESRICQIHSGAIKKMREELAGSFRPAKSNGRRDR